MTDLALPSWVNPRADWGARHARGARPAPLPAQGVYLHHTGMDAQPSDTATSRQVEDVGQARFRYGTSYTFLIHRSGRVDEGHGVEREGTHTVQRLPNGTTRSLNRTHRGICWPGNYQHDRPTPAQIESTARLVAHGILVGWWTRPLVGGHRDIAATACPGDHAYPLIPQINSRASQMIADLKEADMSASPPLVAGHDGQGRWWRFKPIGDFGVECSESDARALVAVTPGAKIISHDQIEFLKRTNALVDRHGKVTR